MNEIPYGRYSAQKALSGSGSFTAGLNMAKHKPETRKYTMPVNPIAIINRPKIAGVYIKILMNGSMSVMFVND